MRSVSDGMGATTVTASSTITCLYVIPSGANSRIIFYGETSFSASSAVTQTIANEFGCPSEGYYKEFPTPYITKHMFTNVSDIRVGNGGGGAGQAPTWTQPQGPNSFAIVCVTADEALKLVSP